MIGRTILSWFRGKAQPEAFKGNFTILGDIRDRAADGGAAESGLPGILHGGGKRRPSPMSKDEGNGSHQSGFCACPQE